MPVVPAYGSISRMICVGGEAVAFRRANGGDRAGFLGAENVFHLHRFHCGERLAGFNPLALATCNCTSSPAIGLSR